jgi:tetrahydromethanopterin S-methyltransferase subunit E
MTAKPWKSAGVNPPNFIDPPKSTLLWKLVLFSFVAVFSVVISFVFVNLTNPYPADAVKEFWGVTTILFISGMCFTGLTRGDK